MVQPAAAPSTFGHDRALRLSRAPMCAAHHQISATGPISASTGSAGEAKDEPACGAAFAGLIKFLGDAKLRTPGTGCRSWPVAEVSQNSFARRMRIVLPDTARWDGSHLRASARGSDRCAPSLPSSAHEGGRPGVLVELRAPDVDKKIAKRTQSRRQESWRIDRAARHAAQKRSGTTWVNCGSADVPFGLRRLPRLLSDCATGS
jgi:hypothetical protein